MNAKTGITIFECGACGSPSVAIPRRLHAAASVSCDRCGRRLCSWAEFRESIAETLSASPRPSVDMLAR